MSFNVPRKGALKDMGRPGYEHTWNKYLHFFMRGASEPSKVAQPMRLTLCFAGKERRWFVHQLHRDTHTDEREDGTTHPARVQYPFLFV